MYRSRVFRGDMLSPPEVMRSTSAKMKRYMTLQKAPECKEAIRHDKQLTGERHAHLPITNNDRILLSMNGRNVVQSPMALFPEEDWQETAINKVEADLAFEVDRQQQQGEQELATKMLQIQSKRFYLDVKQNRRGRFIKVAEIGADGRRSQIFLALSTAAEFRDHLSTFSDFYASLGPPNPDNVPEDGKLKSEMMIKDNRRYYLDLKENSRGRFLRVSQTITRGGPRSQIAIPAQGMIEFRDALTDLLEEFGTDDGGFKGELPEGRHMRVENKNFYFDIGQNNRGIYMRISEVKTNFRTAITVPEKSWARFRDIFADYCEKMKEGGEKVSVAGGSDGGPNAK